MKGSSAIALNVVCISIFVLSSVADGLAQKSRAYVIEQFMAVPTAVLLDGNPTCATLNRSSNPAFTHITVDWGFKVERSGDTPFNEIYHFVDGPHTELQGGAGTSPSSYVHVNVDGDTVDWESNRGITAVIVKGGPMGNVYPYNPASLGGFPNGDGTGLTTGAGQNISHVTFCLEPLAPSAAPASISGRVVDAAGQGIGGAYIMISDVQAGSTRVVMTSPFGYYAVDDLEVASFYTLTVSHKRFVFEVDTMSFTLREDMTGVDFVASP